MKTRDLWLAVLIILSISRADAATGDVEAGRVKAEPCAACHGEQGISSTPTVPSLAGQTDNFLQWQLVFFRSGRRPSPLMAPLAETLEDADIRDLGAYFASLPRAAGGASETEDPALTAKGQAIVAEHHCANCHMDNLLGRAAAASIARQREDYLVQALSDYRSATRPSTGVAAMTEAASGLSDDDIAAIAHYLSTL